MTRRRSSARRWPTWLRVTSAAAGLVVALGLLAVSVAVHRAQPGDPGPFYTEPAPLPEGPLGTIVRSEVVEGYIDGATTYRVLYTSTGYDGNRTAVSGLIIVPNGPAPAAGRKVLAYTHGTVGVASRCAPSLRPADEAPVSAEGAKAFLDAGFVIAATDYQGMGTPGPHPYLVGTSEGMNALDSVRAARNLPEAGAGSDFAVWGHSQGGHASLFTGHLAASYAPELDLVGVAAGAPVPDLIGLFRFNLNTTAGKVLISMALDMWSKVYDANLRTILTTGARPLVTEIARNCLYGPEQLLASVRAALALNLSFLSAPPWEVEPWKTIATENTPSSAALPVPLFIAQGTADEIVAPSITEAYVQKLCDAGQTVDLRLYDGVSHIDTGPDAAPDSRPGWRPASPVRPPPAPATEPTSAGSGPVSTRAWPAPWWPPGRLRRRARMPPGRIAGTASRRPAHRPRPARRDDPTRPHRSSSRSAS